MRIQDAKKSFEALSIDQIDVLKIDTEGCEREILVSLQEVLDNVKIILIEYHSKADRRRVDQLLTNFPVCCPGYDAWIRGV